MAETQTKRLERIEEKIDKITEAVHELSTHSAVIDNRTKDLEVRRQESHERANKFSEKLDHVHDCMHDVKAKVELSHKLMWAVGAAIIVGFINEVMNVI
jgi:methyl-accepting chemotaxis protein